MSESKDSDAVNFVIQSKNDNQKFTVDKKIIDSSALLKNLYDLTNITEPILVDCSSDSLEVFITLINQYQNTCQDEHDHQFEKNLYNSFTKNDKQKLIKLIQDLCILDSDFFLDSAADYILGIVGNEEKIMDWKDIKKYFGFEDDFEKSERKIIKNHELEYFLSIDIENNLKFPFENKNLYSLKTDFSTPMNALIARIIERSNAKTSFLLSLINKTIKNEIDRHPFKLTNFEADNHFWRIEIYFKNLRRGFRFCMSSEKCSKTYFNILKKRKVISAEDISISCDPLRKKKSNRNNSLDFVISKGAKITFCSSYKSIYQFDVTKCPVPYIYYFFTSVDENGIKFEEIFNHLIAKDYTKKIKLLVFNDFFQFFYPRILLRFYKNANASKFEILEIRHHQIVYPKFKDFVTNYMENDGIIKSTNMFKGISLKGIRIEKINEYYHYPVSIVKKYFDCIVTK